MENSLFIKIPQNAIHATESSDDFDLEDEHEIDDELGWVCAGQSLVYKGVQTDNFAAFDGRKFDMQDKIWAQVNIGFGDFGTRLKEKLIGFAMVRGLEFRVEA